MSKKKYEYTKLSVDKKLMDVIEEFIREYPERGYGSIAQFVEEAVRKRAEELKIFELVPRFTHFNLDENGVKISDKKLNMKGIQIFFHPDGILCEYCGTSNCEHIRYAYTVPDIVKVIVKRRREGWNLPSPDDFMEQ